MMFYKVMPAADKIAQEKLSGIEMAKSIPGRAQCSGRPGGCLRHAVPSILNRP
jgi:hypothetical protein